ncbi:CLUMA_CG018085, isoform A [Clunio marinus]|uniref:CLUMA_CG018085, isoform A n=1 Tax=Clunio marinus TaxID=568069 RepID=A0A1J1IXP6_9DIPT|nr:CLUMA_CG018085, isoform A [Clunio marinus]
MKLVILSGFLFILIAQCYGYSQPVIPNTREEGCVDGICASHCAYDGVKIFPSDSLNRPGKCQLMHCASNFDIKITPCPFDMTGEYEWVGKDNTKLYPECCGTKTKRKH